ncbi:hypothetical protein, partial [Pseudoalteromonas sp. B530]|uniref:hypothetical protein n=1 Tax=Pseudoalteromonas sp. B530 TaxID=2994390 RepID=UPI00224B9AC2
MPNSEVKQNSVDDSVDYPCESRTSPGPNKRNPLQQCDGFFAIWDKVLPCSISPSRVLALTSSNCEAVLR